MIQSYFNAEAEKIDKKMGVNGYGEPKLETLARGVKCRKMNKVKLIRNADGNEIISSTEVWFSPGMERLPPESEIIFEGQKSTVIKSSYLPGISENICLQVFLK